MAEESAVERDEVASAVAVLESIVDVDGDDRDAAWERVGLERSTFLGLRLLQLLLVQGQQRGAFPDVFAYARDAHARGGDPDVPLYLVEGVARAPLGEPHLVAGLDPGQVVRVAGYLIRDLVDVLALSATDVDDLIRQVAATPTPPELAEPS